MAADTDQPSEKSLALALSVANDGIWDWDLRSGRTYVSPRVAEIFGFELNGLQLGFESWLQMVHADDRERVQEQWQAHLDGQTDRVHIEHRVQRGDGSFRWVLIRARSLRDDEGKIYRIAGSTTDIHERKSIEQKLADLDASYCAKLKATELSLKRHTETESLVISLWGDLFSLAYEEIDEGITRALRTIGEFTGVDRCYIYLSSQDQQSFELLREWHSPRAALSMPRSVRSSDFPAFLEHYTAFKPLQMNRLDDLPSEWTRVKRMLLSREIGSFVSVPMTYRIGERIGVLVVAQQTQRIWRDETVALLMLAAQALAAALQRKEASPL